MWRELRMDGRAGWVRFVLRAGDGLSHCLAGRWISCRAALAKRLRGGFRLRGRAKLLSPGVASLGNLTAAGAIVQGGRRCGVLGDALAFLEDDCPPVATLRRSAGAGALEQRGRTRLILFDSLAVEVLHAEIGASGVGARPPARTLPGDSKQLHGHAASLPDLLTLS